MAARTWHILGPAHLAWPARPGPGCALTWRPAGPVWPLSWFYPAGASRQPLSAGRHSCAAQTLAGLAPNCRADCVYRNSLAARHYVRLDN